MISPTQPPSPAAPVGRARIVSPTTTAVSWLTPPNPPSKAAGEQNHNPAAVGTLTAAIFFFVSGAGLEEEGAQEQSRAVAPERNGRVLPFPYFYPQLDG